MSDEDDDDSDFIAAYRAQLHHSDEFIQVILNGHLDIEAHLDSFLAVVFEHQKYLDDARLSFHQKLCIARAYAPQTHQLADWEIIRLINGIRNKIAHRSRHQPLAIDVSEIRTIILGKSESLREAAKDADHKELMVYAAALCTGFLSVLEDQLAKYKASLDAREQPSVTD